MLITGGVEPSCGVRQSACGICALLVKDAERGLAARVAVVAREYGLPAVVNTRVGTSVFRTGDRIVLDAERGVVRLAEDGE